MRILERLARDIRYSVRALRRARAMSALAVVSVALGLGANTAIFSLVNALLLRPMSGVRAPERLVGIDAYLPSTILKDLDTAPVFAGTCGVSTPLLTTELQGDVQPIGVLAMTGGCAETFGMRAELGRLIAPQDDSEGSGKVAMLTDSYWRTAFAGKAGAIGSTIRIEGVPFTIVGVAEPQFHGVLLGFWPGALLPAAQDPSGARAKPGTGSYSLVHVFARLANGVSIEQAQAYLTATERRLLEQDAPSDATGERRREFVSQKLHLVSNATGLDYMLRRRFSRPVTVLLGICLLVLTISCVNLANLLLARGVRRRREIALRLAVGASRFQIAQQLATESLLLVLAGLVLGSVLAYAADRVLMMQIQTAFIHFTLNTSPDARVGAFAAAAALITGLGFGVLPAWRSSDVNVAEALKAGRRGGQTAASGRWLISVQIAVTMALMAGASLFNSSLRQLYDAPLGFQTAGVVEAQLFPVPDGYRNFSDETYYRDLLGRVESLAGVETASYSNYAPLWSNGSTTQVRLTSDRETPGVKTETFWVSDGFLKTMSIPLVAGRDFNRGDRAQDVRTAIISQELARRLAMDGNAVGRHIRVGTGPEDQDLEIIGVAANARLNGAREPDPSTVYVNLWQYSYSAKYGVLMVRSRHLSREFVGLLQNTVRGAGHEYVEFARDLETQRGGSLLEERLLAWLSSAFGGLALLLAATGLYGLLAYHVASRTPEIGIRVALGATRANVRWLVLGEVLRLLTVGTLAGLLLTFAAGRYTRSLLYGVRSFEPGPVLAAVAVLGLVATVAAWAPARRACAVEPLEALRHE